MFDTISRRYLDKNNLSNDVDLDSLVKEPKDTKTVPKNDSVKLVRADLQAALKVITSLQDKIKELENTKNDTSSSKCSTCQTDIIRIKGILGINDDPKPNITLNSHNTEPELAKIRKARHIVNIGDLINVDQKTWKFGGSHSDKIMALFRNSEAIIKIYQLKPRVVKGKTFYPVNIYFSSEVASDNAISMLKSVCDKYNIKMPTVQYALTGFPTLQKRVRDLSSILGTAKKNQEISAFSIMNFSMAKDKSIIPLYSVKVVAKGPWSKYMESRTIDSDATSNGHIFQDSASAEEEPNYIETLTVKIMEHIHSIDRTNVPSGKDNKNIQPNSDGLNSQSTEEIENNQQGFDNFIKNNNHHNKRGRSSSLSPLLHATKKPNAVVSPPPMPYQSQYHNPSPQAYSPHMQHASSPPHTYANGYPPNATQVHQHTPHHISHIRPTTQSHISYQHPPQTSVPTLPQNSGIATGPGYTHRPTAQLPMDVAPHGYNYNHNTNQTYQHSYDQQQNSGLPYFNNNM